MNTPTIHIDFETRSACDLPKAGAIRYSKDPSTDVWCMAFAVDDGPVRLWGRGHPEGKQEISYLLDVMDMIEAGATVVAHNLPFELAIWNNCCVPKYGWPLLKPEQGFCTMAMAYAMAIPASLDKASAAMGMDNRKDLQGGRVMQQIAQPRDILADGTIVWWDDPEKIKRVYDYCRQDVAVERDLTTRLLQLSPNEMRIWQLDHKINNRGIRVDLNAVDAAIELVELESDRLDQEMRELTNREVASCKAVKQLTTWVREQGCETDGVAKADVLGLLEDPNTPKLVRQVLALRLEGSKSSTAKLEAFRAGTCPDGRMRGLFQYHGAGTGRWSGRRAQLQNMPRPNLKQKDINKIFEILSRIA